MGWLTEFLPGLLRGQSGISLIENLVAVSILAAIGVVFMTSLDVAHKNVSIESENLQAEILARSQLEDIKNAAYDVDGNYGVTVELPPQYSIDIDVETPDCVGTADNCTSIEDLMGQTITTIQEITVTVYHSDKAVISVSCYKVE